LACRLPDDPLQHVFLRCGAVGHRLPPCPPPPRLRPLRHGGRRTDVCAAPKVAGGPPAAQSDGSRRPSVPSPVVPDFFEVVQTQRAARTFLPDEVDDATVARILTAATHAPSAENSQPFVFIVVRDQATRSAIGDLTARLWDGGARALEEQRLAPAFLRD